VYDESVHASRWFYALLTVPLVAGAVGVAGVASERTLSAPARGTLLALLGAVVVLMVAVALVFGRLRLCVGAGALAFGFGPLRVRLAAAQIASARAERYAWLRYGGWGIRFALRAPWRDRAYSVPFVGSGVSVETVEGRRYYLSSRDPSGLEAAIRGLRGAESAP
jgi:hypothetical protein